MDEAFEDAHVEGWESLESSIELPDPDDRHVVAAALWGRAEAIITENIKHFPAKSLSVHGIEAIRLDDFLLDQYDLNPSATRRIVVEQAAAMTQPPVAVNVLLTRLSRGGAPRFAKLVADNLIFERGE